MELENFFAHYPLFSREEYTTFMNSQGKVNSNTQRELLAYHLKQGHIVKVRRGFYATVSRAISDPKSMPVDGYLIAGRVTKDALLAYHSSLDFHGVAYSMYYTFYFHSHLVIKPFHYQGNEFRRCPFPKSLIASKQEMLATKKEDRQGLDINVTTLERTLVDVLDRPELGGGWEEIWRSLEMIATLDLDLVLEYALALENATTIAKVGFFLETHQNEFAVTDQYLTKLEHHIPRSKHYMDRKKNQQYHLIKRWNLLVPESVLEKIWEEPNDFI